MPDRCVWLAQRRVFAQGQGAWILVRLSKVRFEGDAHVGIRINHSTHGLCQDLSLSNRMFSLN
jgi:hypothetical protein